MRDRDKDPTKKHRHDVGEVDHGPESGAEPTRVLQVMLGICIVASAALALYALIQAGFEVSAP